MKEQQKNSVKQEQIHKLLFNREIGWQEIIHDLINSEQLDPWDINIVVLTDKYLERIHELEEADFFISSKVLLAAALLLRIKAEFLLKRHIKSIDEILFEKNSDADRTKIMFEKNVFNIDFDEQAPELIPRSPIPRFRKVTLQELMESLSKAVKTENRRINKEIVKNRSLYETSFSLPRKKISIKDKIKEIYEKLVHHFKEEERKKIPFTEFSSTDKEEKIITFAGLLHLDHQKKVWLEQEKHFDDFYIWLAETYLKHNPNLFADLREENAEKNKENFEGVEDTQIKK